MLNTKKRISLTIGALACFAALVLGIFVAQHAPDEQKKLREQFQGTLLDQPRDMHRFNLIGIDEKKFTRKSLKNHWTLVFFGFTNCESICPLTMAELGKMYRLLKKQHVSEAPRVVMISIDPARDTVAALSHYVKSFNPHFYGAVGSDKAVRDLTRELGVVYMRQEAQQGRAVENYNIQHSGTIMLFNPHGQLMAFFTPPHAAAALAADYELALHVKQ